MSGLDVVSVVDSNGNVTVVNLVPSTDLLMNGRLSGLDTHCLPKSGRPVRRWQGQRKSMRQSPIDLLMSGALGSVQMHAAHKAIMRFSLYVRETSSFDSLRHYTSAPPITTNGRSVMELKSCPFCGKPAKLHIGSEKIMIACISRKCWGQQITEFHKDGQHKTIKIAITKWNRRTGGMNE